MINEHDIRDFPDSPYSNQGAIQKKLYELKNCTWFMFSGNKYLFVKPDGAYAIIENPEGVRGNMHMGCEVLIPLEG